MLVEIYWEYHPKSQWHLQPPIRAMPQAWFKWDLSTIRMELLLLTLMKMNHGNMESSWKRVCPVTSSVLSGVFHQKMQWKRGYEGLWRAELKLLVPPWEVCLVTVEVMLKGSMKIKCFVIQSLHQKNLQSWQREDSLSRKCPHRSDESAVLG